MAFPAHLSDIVGAVTSRYMVSIIYLVNRQLYGFMLRITRRKMVSEATYTTVLA
jgi:hypothetical protein